MRKIVFGILAIGLLAVSCINQKQDGVVVASPEAFEQKMNEPEVQVVDVRFGRMLDALARVELVAQVLQVALEGRWRYLKRGKELIEGDRGAAVEQLVYEVESNHSCHCRSILEITRQSGNLLPASR